jgi:hypothetical protein
VLRVRSGGLRVRAIARKASNDAGLRAPVYLLSFVRESGRLPLDESGASTSPPRRRLPRPNSLPSPTGLRQPGREGQRSCPARALAGLGVCWAVGAVGRAHSRRSRPNWFSATQGVCIDMPKQSVLAYAMAACRCRTGRREFRFAVSPRLPGLTASVDRSEPDAEARPAKGGASAWLWNRGGCLRLPDSPLVFSAEAHLVLAFLRCRIDQPDFS